MLVFHAARDTLDPVAGRRVSVLLPAVQSARCLESRGTRAPAITLIVVPRTIESR